MKKAIIIVGAILLIASMTAPTSQAFDQWISSEYDVQCKPHKKDCEKSGEPISLSSSAYTNVGIYSTYEITYKREHNENLTYRMIGFMGLKLPVTNDNLWGALGIY